jgi:HK97 gp10 family phage protein
VIRNFASLDALAQHFAAVSKALPAAQPAMLGAAGAVVQRIAKAKFGEYQAGWAPLARTTVTEKERLGFSPPDNPLLRTGEIRESIGVTVSPPAVTIGSADPIARYLEVGTSRMPPRPFLGPAMIEARPEIEVVVVGGIARVFRETE